MLRFDKLKIVSNVEYISAIDTNIFLTHSKGGAILYYKYHQDSPFSLTIQVDVNKNELVIEFTGKILMDDYPQLINSNNIRTCFENINRLGICQIDTDAVIRHGMVNKCDVTRNITSDKMKEIIKQMKSNISNYDKWNCDKYEGNGIVIYKSVKTARYKERLCIYDKGREMGKACNREFMNSISDEEKMASYFKNKIRFELNINTCKQIRELLEIPDNKLLTVLSAEANPLLRAYDEAIREDNTMVHCSSLKERMMVAFIRECGNDLERVEVEIRNTIPKTTSVKRTMQPFRELYAKMQQGELPPVDVRKLIA